MCVVVFLLFLFFELLFVLFVVVVFAFSVFFCVALRRSFFFSGSLKCTSSSSSHHEHANLLCGRASHAAIYPEKLCFSILRGLRNQLINNKVMYRRELATACEEPAENEFQNSLERSGYFIDDVSGRQSA